MLSTQEHAYWLLPFIYTIYTQLQICMFNVDNVFIAIIMFWSLIIAVPDTWFLPCSQLPPQLRGKLCVLHGLQLHIVYIKAPGHPNRTQTVSVHAPYTAPESQATRQARRGLLPGLREGRRGEGIRSSWRGCWWSKPPDTKPLWFICTLDWNQ